MNRLSFTLKSWAESLAIMSAVIGASLNKPHTSVTALCMCVCMLACLLACLRPYTVNFKWARLNFNIRKIELMHSVGEGLLPECSVGDLERRWLKLKHAWQLTPCRYRSLTGGCPQAVQILIMMVVEVAQGKGHAQTALINTNNSAHDFSVKA